MEIKMHFESQRDKQMCGILKNKYYMYAQLIQYIRQ